MNKLLILLFLTLNLSSSVMNEISLEHEGVSRSYLLYVPDNISLDDENDLVIGLHGYTGTASGFEKETTGGFNITADKYGFIVIYPQGAFFNANLFRHSFISSWNDLVGSKNATVEGEICSIEAEIAPKYPECKNSPRCSWTSCSDDIGFIKKIIDKIKKDNNIRNIYLLGMSNGGMMAQAMACKYPELFKAVVNIVGMQHKGGSCVPDKPVNFIIYAGMKDIVVPPINIESYDGYYYEPMNNTFNAWSEKFNCLKFDDDKYVYFDEFEQKTAFDCNNNVKIYSILNIDRGHLWPGISSNGGYCATSAQSNIKFLKCKKSNKNQWGNDFLMEIILNL